MVGLLFLLSSVTAFWSARTLPAGLLRDVMHCLAGLNFSVALHVILLEIL